MPSASVTPLELVSICRKCRAEHNAPPAAASHPCVVDALPIMRHAESGYCAFQPPKYGDGIKPAGWDERQPETAAAPTMPPVARPPAAMPRSEWPAWAVAVAKFAKPQDKGVGDTLERLINAGMGFGDAWKALRATLRLPCNCERDRDRLNVLYGY